MSVKRYDLTPFPQAEAFGPNDNGRYVEHSDYAALEAERDQLRQDRDTLAAKLDASEKRSESYRQEVLAWTAAGKNMVSTLAATDASGAMQRAAEGGGG